MGLDEAVLFANLLTVDVPLEGKGGIRLLASDCFAGVELLCPSEIPAIIDHDATVQKDNSQQELNSTNEQVLPRHIYD